MAEEKEKDESLWYWTKKYFKLSLDIRKQQAKDVLDDVKFLGKGLYIIGKDAVKKKVADILRDSATCKNEEKKED